MASRAAVRARNDAMCDDVVTPQRGGDEQWL